MFFQDDSYFANMFMLTQERVDQLFKSFETAFPHLITLDVCPSEFVRIQDDAVEISGNGHPETFDTYSKSVSSWSFWHSKITHIFEDGVLRLRVVLGFANPSDAMRFKLMWA